MNLLCKLGIHRWGVVSKPTIANGLNGTYIRKMKIACKRCGETKLKKLKYKKL